MLLTIDVIPDLATVRDVRDDVEKNLHRILLSSLHVIFNLVYFRICSCVGVASEGSPDHTLCRQNITEVLDALFISLTDYTTDRRGDIGAM